MSLNPEASPTDAPHRRQLRRVAFLLLGVAVVDVAMFAYCVTNRINFSSSVGVGSLVASLFLFLGNLRAASLVRWLAAAVLPMLLVVIAAIPLLMPVDLLRTYFRLRPLGTMMVAIYGIALIALSVTLLRMLRHDSIATARTAAGRPRRNLLIPAALGLVLSMFLVSAVYYLTHGRAARRAEELAAAQLGPDYRYFASHLSMHWRGDDPKRSYLAQVTAWNSREIKTIPVWWDE